VGGDNDGDNPLDFRHGPRNWLQIRLPAAAFIRKTIDLPGYHVGGIYGGSATRYPNPAISRMRVGEVGGGWILSPYSLPHWDVDMPALRQLHILHCAHLEIIPPIDSPVLENLRIEDCPLLKGLPDMDAFKALRKLHIRDCASLDSFPSLDACTQLESLQIRGCHEMLEIPSVTQLTALTTLVLLDVRQRPPALTHMVRLQSLTCDTLPCLNNQAALRALCIEDAFLYVRSLPSLVGLRTLKTLTVKCERLTKFPDPVNMTALTHLELRDCRQLRNLPSLVGLTALKNLFIVNCHADLAAPQLAAGVLVDYVDGGVIVID
jgi:hypothetical protein